MLSIVFYFLSSIKEGRSNNVEEKRDMRKDKTTHKKT
jgi:hypothetical protein